MKVLIIEDELPAANRLIELVKATDAHIEIVGLVDSNAGLESWINSNESPDLIFSDIELLDGQVFVGLSVLKISAPIIFTTAYEQYALKAFDSMGISYLLKPFELEGIKQALEKFKMLQKPNSVSPEILKSVQQLLTNPTSQYKKKLTVKVGSGIYLLSIDDISAIITQNGIPYAYKESGKKVPLSGLVSELESTLDPKSFHRINRSEIINSHFIEKIEAYFNDRLAIKVKGVEEKLIVSGSRTPAFRKWLDEL